jgi:hypothetical protein
MYKILAVYHSNNTSMYNYLEMCKSNISNTYSDITFDIVDQTDSNYIYYINGDRYPVFIMYKNDIPYSRLIGKVNIETLCSWIQKTFD